MARGRKGQLEQRYVYMEGKRKTKGYALYTYHREIEQGATDFWREEALKEKTNFWITRQRHRRGFHLRGKLGTWPAPFGFYSRFRTVGEKISMNAIRD